MNANSKRRKTGQNSSPSSILGNGCKGILITCDRGKENQSCLELYRLLDEFIEKNYGKLQDSKIDEQDNEKNPLLIEKSTDLSSQLNMELNSLKNNKKQKNYSRIDMGMKAVIFVRLLNEQIDPVIIVQDIYHTSKKENTSLVRFCARLIPVQCTCYAHVDDVINMLKPLIESSFKDIPKGTKWYARLTVRNNNVFSKEECISKLLPLLEPDYPSDYRNPSIAINVEVNKGTACIAIIPEWDTMNDLSLRTLLVEKEKKIKTKQNIETKIQNINEDWKCLNCNSPNFKTIMTCWKCKTPRIIPETKSSHENEIDVCIQQKNEETYQLKEQISTLKENNLMDSNTQTKVVEEKEEKEEEEEEQFQLFG